MRHLLVAAMVILGSMPSVVKAQEGENQKKFAIEALSNFNTKNDRVGISGAAKYYFNTKDVNGDRFFIKGKLTHTPPSNGGFFKAFSDGKYNNTSAVYLMGGYQFNFRTQSTAPQEDFKKQYWFAEMNIGGAYLHEDIGFAYAPLIGYSLSDHFSLLASYQGVATGKKKSNLGLIELGISYKF